MSACNWSAKPVYGSRDLDAAERIGYERGRLDGYLDGYRDGATGAQVEAAAEAAVFADLISRTFRGAVPHVERIGRRAEASGHPEVFAASLAAARAQAARLQTIPTTERTAA